MEGSERLTEYKNWYKQHYNKPPSETCIENFCKINNITFDKVENNINGGIKLEKEITFVKAVQYRCLNETCEGEFSIDGDHKRTSETVLCPYCGSDKTKWVSMAMDPDYKDKGEGVKV